MKKGIEQKSDEVQSKRRKKSKYKALNWTIFQRKKHFLKKLRGNGKTYVKLHKKAESNMLGYTNLSSVQKRS